MVCGVGQGLRHWRQPDTLDSSQTFISCVTITPISSFLKACSVISTQRAGGRILVNNGLLST